jgi:hypothetical protein
MGKVNEVTEIKNYICPIYFRGECETNSCSHRRLHIWWINECDVKVREGRPCLEKYEPCKRLSESEIFLHRLTNGL